MLVFGHSGFPVILFPTSRGRYYQCKDFKLVEAASDLINSGRIKIYCPDGIDSESWYNYSIHPADRVKTHIGYQELILNDVIEFAKYDSGMRKVTLSGCSFGAYHAANMAFRYPDRVSYLLCMGGAYNIKQFIMGYYDDNCYYNNPPDYLSGLNDLWYLSRYREMGIVLGTGELDMCLDENILLSKILNEKNIKHWLDVRKGTGHDWNWWREMFPYYLSQIND